MIGISIPIEEISDEVDEYIPSTDRLDFCMPKEAEAVYQRGTYNYGKHHNAILNIIRDAGGPVGGAETAPYWFSNYTVTKHGGFFDLIITWERHEP